jgi:hypothetical protein
MLANRPLLVVAVIIVIAIPILMGQVRSIVTWAIQLKRADIARRSIPVGDVSHQLELLQQSVDAMAIEVERISEAQRAAARPQLEATFPSENRERLNK